MTDDLLAGVEAAAGFAVYGGPRGGFPPRAGRRSGIPGLLAGQDPTLWGPDAEDRAQHRLGFLDAYRRSRELLPLIAELHEELGRAQQRGAGRRRRPRRRGRSPAPLGRPLTVLDDPDPHPVRAAARRR